ncbi:MAG: taurine dioxygenase [Gammaproteobacteria bacterium]|jgi:taurine dioxygenase
MQIDVTPISPAIGAEIDGVDITKPLNDADFAAVNQALLDHLIIVFRDQPLDDAALMGLGRRFSPLVIHPFLKPNTENPEVVAILREPGDETIVGEDWHADTTHIETPPMGAVLHAIEVPPVGGDTMFANQYLAYESLSDGMKRMLGTLNAVHDDTQVAGPNSNKNRTRANKVRDDPDWQPTSNIHPVVRTHPETGRKSLFVNRSYSHCFENLTPEESLPLMSYLLAHATRPDFTCRVRWEAGTTVIWDNRCMKHIAVNDVVGHRRVMRRVQMTGDRPF